MKILIDFDGTCVTHVNPGVGKDIGAMFTLKELVHKGHKLILFTMRSHKDNGLNEAISWFQNRGIELYGVQTDPEQHIWTTSPKAYGELIIDDTGIGIPLTYDKSYSDRPFVNWIEVRKLLVKRGVL